MKMLSKRFEYDGKSILRLNELQFRMKKQIEKKIEEGVYSSEEVPCCVCGGKNFENLSKKDRYGLYVPVAICRDCGLIQMNPRMMQESYNQFYKLEYWKFYTGDKTPPDDFFKSEYKRGGGIYQYISENMKRGIVNALIVEIGCSAGGILQYFKDKGNDVYGVDLGSESIEFGRDNYNLNIETGTLDNVIKQGLSPDIIIYSHVLEHILDPVEEITKLKSIVAPNTYLYIEVPGIKYLTHSYHMDFLKQLQNAHLYYFTLKTLKNVLRKAGWGFVCGDEIIHSIFRVSSNKEVNYESDYDDVLSFLRRMEFYRFMPTPYNVKRLTMPATISFLERVGLYNTAKRVYYKFKP